MGPPGTLPGKCITRYDKPYSILMHRWRFLSEEKTYMSSEIQSAGMGKRISAFIIDFIVVWTLILVWTQFAKYFFEAIELPYYPRFSFMGSYNTEQWNFFLVFIAEIFFWYSAVFLSGMFLVGQTFGQLTLGIKWIKNDHSELQRRQIIERWLIGILKICLVIFPGPALARIFPTFNSWSMFMLMSGLLFLIFEPFISIHRLGKSLSDKYAGILLVRN